MGHKGKLECWWGGAEGTSRAGAMGGSSGKARSQHRCWVNPWQQEAPSIHWDKTENRMWLQMQVDFEMWWWKTWKIFLWYFLFPERNRRWNNAQKWRKESNKEVVGRGGRAKFLGYQGVCLLQVFAGELQGKPVGLVFPCSLSNLATWIQAKNMHFLQEGVFPDE